MTLVTVTIKNRTKQSLSVRGMDLVSWRSLPKRLFHRGLYPVEILAHHEPGLPVSVEGKDVVTLKGQWPGPLPFELPELSVLVLGPRRRPQFAKVKIQPLIKSGAGSQG